MNQTDSPPRRIRPYDGWALTAAIVLDRAHPGFLSSSLRARNLRRQVHFAAFATIDLNHPEILAACLRAEAGDQEAPTTRDPLAQIARYLLDLPPRSILKAVFGSCPEGLIGLFARLGAMPLSLDRSLYRLAWSLYTEPHHRERRKLLLQTPGTITAMRIRVVSLLDGILLCRAVLDRLCNPGEVINLREAVRLIKSLVPEATDDRLRQSLEALAPAHGGRRLRKEGLAAWTLRWLARMEHAPVKGPFATDDPDLRLLVGRALVDAGRQYRNCLSQHLGYVAAGRKLFYEWKREPGAIVELNCLSDGRGQIHFSVGQIKGAGNARLLPEMLNAIRARLSRSGVLFNGAMAGQRVPLYSLLDIFEDEAADHTVVSFLDGLETAWKENATEVA